MSVQEHGAGEHVESEGSTESLNELKAQIEETHVQVLRTMHQAEFAGPSDPIKLQLEELTTVELRLRERAANRAYARNASPLAANHKSKSLHNMAMSQQMDAKRGKVAPEAWDQTDDSPEQTLPFPEPLFWDEAQLALLTYGRNNITANLPSRWYTVLFHATVHPFNIVLTALAIFSIVNKDYSGTIIIFVMVSLSIGLRFVQELKSDVAAEKLKTLVHNKATVVRYKSFPESSSPFDGRAEKPEVIEMEIPMEEIVPGDWIKLAAGDIIPGDLQIMSSKDLFVTQSALTGEAIPVEKMSGKVFRGSGVPTRTLLSRKPTVTSVYSGVTVEKTRQPLRRRVVSRTVQVLTGTRANTASAVNNLHPTVTKVNLGRIGDHRPLNTWRRCTAESAKTEGWGNKGSHRPARSLLHGHQCCKRHGNRYHPSDWECDLLWADGRDSDHHSGTKRVSER